MSQPVGIVGGGAFGRALATAAARVDRSVISWSRTPRDFEHPKVSVSSDLASLRSAELLFLAVPSPHVPALCEELGRHLDGAHLVVHVSRGLVGDKLETLTEIIRETTPVRRVGALAGPLVARGLEQGEPGGGIVGTLFPEVAEAVREALGGPTLRIYDTDDVLGVELASAFVGLVTLAMGYAKAAGFGPGTLAVLATRGHGRGRSTRAGPRTGPGRGGAHRPSRRAPGCLRRGGAHRRADRAIRRSQPGGDTVGRDDGRTDERYARQGASCRCAHASTQRRRVTRGGRWNPEEPGPLQPTRSCGPAASTHRPRGRSRQRMKIEPAAQGNQPSSWEPSSPQPMRKSAVAATA